MKKIVLLIIIGIILTFLYSISNDNIEAGSQRTPHRYIDTELNVVCYYLYGYSSKFVTLECIELKNKEY